MFPPIPQMTGCPGQTWRGRLLLLAALLLGWVGAAAGIRVVSQTVGTDEWLLAVAAPGQVAALSHLARDPAFSGVATEARAYPQIESGDAEKILKFQPTLVLFADYSRPELVSQVRRAGVKVMIFDRYRTLGDAYDALRRLAAELGTEEKAEAVIADCQRRVEALQTRLAGVKPVRVIAPSTYGAIPGDRTTFQDICDHAGADNLGASLGGLHGHDKAPTERMLSWPVDMVVVEDAGSVEASLLPYADLPPYKFMEAVKKGRAARMAPWQLGCVSHLRVQAYERLARELHPEVFKK